MAQGAISSDSSCIPPAQLFDLHSPRDSLIYSTFLLFRGVSRQFFPAAGGKNINQRFPKTGFIPAGYAYLCRYSPFTRFPHRTEGHNCAAAAQGHETRKHGTGRRGSDRFWSAKAFAPPKKPRWASPARLCCRDRPRCRYRSPREGSPF